MPCLLLSVLLSIPLDVAGVRSAALHRPEGAGPFPAVLMVEGWWTAQAWDATTADRLADEGYLVLRVLPDRGDRPADRDAMHALMTGPPDDRTMAGLRAARDWLRASADVRESRVAAVGARMGGRDALHLAAEPGLAAAVSWYGAPPPKAPSGAPAIAFFGGQDMGPSPEDARRFEQAARGTATEVHIYPEAQHGFADPRNPWGGYDAKAAADSWDRARAFLAARLEPSGPPPTASGSAARASVACVIDAWNVFDVGRSRKCYSDSAMAVWAGERKPIDWEAERRYRAFDAAASSVFRFAVLAERDASIEFALHETNDFLRALGLDGVTVRWRYVVRDGRIVEEEFLDADDAFPGVLREFTAWGRVRRPSGWASVSDSKGQVHFDGATAPGLVALAREWSRSKAPDR